MTRSGSVRTIWRVYQKDASTAVIGKLGTHSSDTRTVSVGRRGNSSCRPAEAHASHRYQNDHERLRGRDH